MRIVDERFLAYIRTEPCIWCDAFPGYSAAAHVYARGMGSGSRLDVPTNVAPLCFECHRSHHNGKEPTKEQLWQKIAERLGLESWEVCRDAVHRLLRRPK